MKAILIFALLAAVGTVLFTGCTTVPRDNTVQDTSVRRDTSTTSTYSK
jgi:hypothetical protein